MILKEINDLDKLNKEEWTVDEIIELIRNARKSKTTIHIMNTNNMYQLLKPNAIKEILNKYSDKNIYFITLYILLLSTKDNQITIYEKVMRKLTDCERKYQNKNNFSIKVIKNTIQDINDETELNISITTIIKDKKTVGWILEKEKNIYEK